MTASRIYLTGFMGSGKSTIGGILANVLGYAFEDLDGTIAERTGQSVQDFFSSRGEGAFRALETDVLHATAQRDRLVVATGGGALARPDNMAWARAHGMVVYLALHHDSLVERLRHLAVPRPLLLGPGGERLSPEALRARAVTLLREREPVYRRAHIMVQTDALSVGQSVEAVARALRRRSPRQSLSE